ncbi:hypothetical protein TRVL_08849 [Trypanosoma vivax]|nr:hypothetical protein TRVL_08849 [Trypanosoma vivax]
MHSTGSAEYRHTSGSNTPHDTAAARTHHKLAQRHLKHPSLLLCFRSLNLMFITHRLSTLTLLKTIGLPLPAQRLTKTQTPCANLHQEERRLLLSVIAVHSR